MSLERAQATRLRGPACGSRLVEVERAEVLIDACPECRGVCLDRGELDKILVRERRMRGGRDDDEDFLREVEGRRRVPERGARGETPPGDAAQRVYARAGFRRVATMLRWSVVD
jgi:Zn-finger nucleic acid-binding protein